MISEVSLSRRTFGDGLMVYFVAFFFYATASSPLEEFGSRQNGQLIL